MKDVSLGAHCPTCQGPGLAVRVRRNNGPAKLESVICSSGCGVVLIPQVEEVQTSLWDGRKAR